MGTLSRYGHCLSCDFESRRDSTIRFHVFAVEQTLAEQQLTDVDPRAVGEDRRPLEHVEELAHVAVHALAGQRHLPRWFHEGVAMVVAGEPVVGAVALPGLELTLSTANPPTIPEVGATPPRMIVSRSRPPAAATLVAEKLGAELVEMGSAGAKAMSVVRGESEMYAHSGGQYEWDSCAPVAVALAAGLHATRADGSPMTYNHENPYLPDLLICRKEYAQAALAALAEADE